MLYDKLITAGVSRETARDVLPLATESTMYMKGSVRSWIHYLELRCSQDTQLEHREIADAIKSIFNNEFPNISEALGWRNSYGT
jgi:thymidylate synthase (FAD)